MRTPRTSQGLSHTIAHDCSSARLRSGPLIDVADDTAGASLAGVFRGNPYADGELFLKDAGGPNYLIYSSDTKFRTYADVPGGVPEPSTWALLILGFIGAGAALRRSRALGQAA